MIKMENKKVTSNSNIKYCKYIVFRHTNFCLLTENHSNNKKTMIMIRLKIAQNKKIMNKYLLRIQEKVQNYEK